MGEYQMTQKYLLAISVIMICVAAFVSPVYAQSENEWFQTNEGMDGGVINDIVFNPQNSNVLYAATKNGLYITENGGEFWFQANKGFTDYHVNHIAINPHMPEQIYVATKREGVFRSNDGGSSWQVKNNGLEELDVLTIEIDSLESSIIFAVTKHQLYKSIDYGESWNPVREIYALEGSFQIRHAIKDGNLSVWFYSDGTRAFYKSIDCGETWEMFFDNAWGSIKNIEVEKTNSDRIYLLDTHWFFRSEDGGYTWFKHDTVFMFDKLTINQNDTSLIYAIKGNEIFKSKNYGDDFIAYGSSPGIFPLKKMLIHPQDQECLYVTSNGFGIQKTEDNGENWVEVNKNIHAHEIVSLTYDSRKTNTIYAATSSGWIYISTNHGESWQLLTTALSRRRITDIAISSQDTPVIFVTIGTEMTHSKLFRSLDGGETWEIVEPSRIFASHAIRIDPTSSTTVYVGTDRKSIIKSVNLGDDWTFYEMPPSAFGWISDLAINPQNPETIYVAGQFYYFKSENGGSDWEELPIYVSYPHYGCIVIDPINTNTVYALGYDGVFKSHDHGNTWKLFIRREDIGVANKLAYDPGTESLYISIDTGGVFISPASGESLLDISSGLMRLKTNTLLDNTSVPGSVFVGTDGGGVYRTKGFKLENLIYLPMIHNHE